MRASFLLASFVAAAAATALGCSATTEDEETQGSAGTGTQNDGFYMVEQRGSPFAKGVNLQKTVCADRRSRPDCPIGSATMEGNAFGNDLRASILRNFARGSVLVGNAVAYGRLVPSPPSAILEFSAAFVRQSYGQPSGIFYLATCAADCSTWTLRRVNAPAAEAAITVPAPTQPDYPLVGQDTADVARVGRAMSTGSAIVTGNVEGRTFKPTAFYLK